VYVKAGVVKTTFKQYRPFFNKIEVFTEREIRESIINDKQAENCYRQPEKYLCENLNRFLKSDYPCVLHTAGL